jgi:hypothetical protein
VCLFQLLLVQSNRSRYSPQRQSCWYRAVGYQWRSECDVAVFKWRSSTCIYESTSNKWRDQHCVRVDCARISDEKRWKEIKLWVYGFTSHLKTAWWRHLIAYLPKGKENGILQNVRCGRGCLYPPIFHNDSLVAVVFPRLVSWHSFVVYFHCLFWKKCYMCSSAN